ncbi:MAG: hypothetical protein U5L45_02775 [Saprospiraceae bacterium]|nr:hypothetical protein [Saprospiraceae bacterium]
MTFGTERVKSLIPLTEWLKADEPADNFQTKILNIYYDQLVRKVDAWNEDELKFFFFDATKEIELFKIFSILKRCKSYIEEWVK